MEDKQVKNTFLNISDEELQFTQKDRQKVFDQINKQNRGIHITKKTTNVFQKILPPAVILIIIGLCLFVFVPSLLSGNLTKESSTIASNTPVGQESKVSTTLITVKSHEMDDRIYLNLLITYKKNQKMMKVVTLPAETYAPVSTNNDGTVLYKKLMFAYQYGGADNVKTVVSKLLDVPIDYYSVIDIETISTFIDSVNGIEYDLPEDLRVRAITQAAFEFEKGEQRFNGEEVIALLMAATEGGNLDEVNLVYLLQAIINKMETEKPSTHLKEMLTQIEANTPLNSLLENPPEINSIKAVSLREGMQTDAIIFSENEGEFYYKFEKEFLDTVSKDLTTFN